MIPGIVSVQSVFALPATILPPLTPTTVTDTETFRVPFISILHRTLAPGLVTSADSFPTTFIGGGVPATSFATSINVTLSNNNLTGTHVGTTLNAGAHSLTYKTTGKYYFEVAMTTVHGASDCCGIIRSPADYYNFVTAGLDCVVIYKANGNIYSNNVNSGKSLGAIASGDLINIAVDLTGHKAWLRKNGTGNWNGISTENPATGVGGVPIPPGGSSFAPAIGFGGAGTAANDQMTAAFTNWAFAAPSGFGVWPPT